jgi:hypothetical protein
MDSQGRIVLPRTIRPKGQSYFACQTEKDGTVHLIPVVGVITVDQAYFWTRRWQRGEKAASKALRRKNYRTVPPGKLAAYLKSL